MVGTAPENETFSFVDMENHPLKVISLAELYSFAESREDIFKQLGIQLSLGENTFHMYWVLLLIFLSDCRYQKSKSQSWLYFACVAACVCLCVCVQCMILDVRWHLSVHVCIKWGYGNCLRRAILSAKLTSYCKQITDGRTGHFGHFRPVVFARK